MDEVFDAANCRNDICRVKCNPKIFKRKGYGNIKDMVLFFSKSKKYIWHEPLIQRNSAEVEKLFIMVDSLGRSYTTNPLHAPGETINGSTGKMWKGKLPCR